MSIRVECFGGSTSGESTPFESRRRFDVTGMDARGVQQLVEEDLATDRISLEHRGARTYLLME